MNNRLQYIYSIVVFMGVLATSYLLIHREADSRSPLQGMSSGTEYKREAGMDNPAFESLFEIEKAFSEQKLKEEKEKQQKAPASLPFTGPFLRE